MPGVNPRANQPLLDRLGLLFPLLIVLAMIVMVVPLPALVMDLLLAGNITIAVMVLLTAIQVRKPLEFSVFPALLLGTTLSRLVLNIASTRLILSNGASAKQEAAGGIIQAFGEFVAGGNLAIGLVLFLILIAIQFLVITKGATRISEVAARFMLDALPGKQMAIDAELNAGAITAGQARQRREELSQQTDFYGAMDGASKFVRGDALAGIVITSVNIIGGLYVGIVQQGMDLGEATKIFSTLTIGDGLVSQMPAFLIALAAGFLVTRSSSESNLSLDATRQLFQSPSALFVSGAFLLALSFTGLPQGPMITLGGACLLLGFLLQNDTEQQTAPSDETASTPAASKKRSDLYDRLQVEPLELVLGIGLLKLTRPESGNLIARLTQLRQEIAEELGLIVPSIRVRDDLILDRNEYRILIRGVEIARGTAYSDGYLALETPEVTRTIPGIELPHSSLMPKAIWIENQQAGSAGELGYRVVDPVTALMIHLGEVVREHASELLNRQQVYDLLERLKRTVPRLVEELVPQPLSPVVIHQVLSNLLSERVPIRDLESILQELGDRIAATTDIRNLTESVRRILAGTICEQYHDSQRRLWAISFEKGCEQELIALASSPHQSVEPRLRDLIETQLGNQYERLLADGKLPVVVCDSRIRATLKQLCDETLPRLAVLAREEVSRETQTETVYLMTGGNDAKLRPVAA